MAYFGHPNGQIDFFIMSRCPPSQKISNLDLWVSRVATKHFWSTQNGHTKYKANFKKPYLGNQMANFGHPNGQIDFFTIPRCQTSQKISKLDLWISRAATIQFPSTQNGHTKCKPNFKKPYLGNQMANFGHPNSQIDFFTMPRCQTSQKIPIWTCGHQKQQQNKFRVHKKVILNIRQT